MYFVAFLCIAASGLAFAASELQGHGFPWADETCSNFSWACDNPDTVIFGAVAIAAGLWIVRNMYEPG